MNGTLDSPRTLITGATGFLGRHLLFRHLESGESSRLALLVRERAPLTPRRRLELLLAPRYGKQRMESMMRRIDLVVGDTRREHFGLEERAYRDLSQTTGRVLHVAASVAMDQPYETLRETNVVGTRHVLDFCSAARRSGPFERLDYVGTAYVAGTRQGTVFEEELDCGQDFRNGYERSKFDAEKLVRQRGDEFPLAVHRPSIIVGDSTTGQTTSFNAMYMPLMIYARGWWRWVPGSPETEVDLVPVDYVSNAIFHLAQTEQSLGRCFHIVAGDGSTTVGVLERMAGQAFDCKPVRYVSPHVFQRFIRPAAEVLSRPFAKYHALLVDQGSVYLPYFSMALHFDDRQARRILDSLGVRPPKVEDYFARVLEYCKSTDWGWNAAAREGSAPGAGRPRRPEVTP